MKLKLSFLLVLLMVLFFESSFAQSQVKPKQLKVGSSEPYYSNPEKTTLPVNENNTLITISGNPKPGQQSNTGQTDLSAKQAKEFPHIPVNDGSSAYQSAKTEWIKNYPAEYEAWVRSNNEKNLSGMPAEEPKASPKERQNTISNKPHPFIITPDK